MDKGKVIHFKRELIDSHEFSEIDFHLHDFIGYDYEKHDNYTDVTYDKHGKTGTYPIDIDVMIEKLKEMKGEGASHVSLEYHVDHIGYMIDGWKISTLSDKEVKEFHELKKKKVADKVEKRKKELEDELNKLNKIDMGNL